ncbi:MAG: glycosyltransferase family 2 protein [Clostridia bacterium]|nr:glycosyltransferase family 2 protein [Clostridia bacterium]
MGNNENDLISVIIPCYNVKDYVRKAVDSVLNQSYKNLEIIIVDDSSTDGTYEILKEYEEENKGKITLIRNEENSGSAAYSRNVALKVANGEYIGFIDPDDYVDEDYFLNLYNALKENDSLISCTDIVLVDEKGRSNKWPYKML